jgi:2-polyprenyl-3-methyl-5-hydroxy-6-metoxy-1,4-benzoquinol methylase
VPQKMKDRINKTSLDIEKACERGIIHRDYLAHSLRWNYVLRFVRRGMRILDVGCGNGMLMEVLYRNKFKPDFFVGIDVSPSAIDKLLSRKTNFTVRGIIGDIRTMELGRFEPFDVITCFEVIEHFEPQYIEHVFKEMIQVLKPGGILLLSTPNFSTSRERPVRHADAANHVYEYDEEELQAYLEKYFVIEKKMGTFASQKDILPVMSTHEQWVFNRLKPWMDSHILSVIFASLHPSESRNILWICRPRR